MAYDQQCSLGSWSLCVFNKFKTFKYFFFFRSEYFNIMLLLVKCRRFSFFFDCSCSCSCCCCCCFCFSCRWRKLLCTMRLHFHLLDKRKPNKRKFMFSRKSNKKVPAQKLQATDLLCLNSERFCYFHAHSKLLAELCTEIHFFFFFHVFMFINYPV